MKTSAIVGHLDMCSVHICFHESMVITSFDRGVADAVLRGHKPTLKRRNSMLHERLDGQRRRAVVDEHRTGMEGGSDGRAMQSVDATTIAAEGVFDCGSEFGIVHATAE